jgi:RHS repeat-associated protein
VGIGCDYDASTIGHNYDGLIDDVRIYNTLITDFSDQQELGSPYASTTKAYYKLNNTYADETTNNNTLTATNTPTFSTSVPFGVGGGGTPTTTVTYTYATSTQSKKKYIGEYYDAASQLSYLNARYYDPARGQFLSEDPT